MQGALQTSLGTVPNAPFDFCVTRKKERRSYKDPKTGQLCTAVHETDTHYHLRVACVQAAELSYHLCRARWSFLREGHLQSATKAILQRSSVRESTRLNFFVFVIVSVLFWVRLAVEFQSCLWASIAW